MKEYFRLQYRMINRKFKDAGFEPILAWLILLVAFVAVSFYLFYKTEFAAYAYVLIALTMVSNYSEARRNEFFKISFGESKFRKIRIIENLLLTFPFFIFLLYQQCFLLASLLLILTAIFALVIFHTTISFTIWTPFSKKPFEFPVGFRYTFYLIIAAYALTIIAAFVNNFNLGIFSMLLLFAICLGYYTKPENEYYVWIYKFNPNQFLFSKLKTALLFSTLLVLPILLTLGITFQQNINMLALFYLVGSAFLICMIVSKYAAFPDELNITQAIILSLCLFFPPLLIVLIPYLFFKSQKRLSYLLQ